MTPTEPPLDRMRVLLVEDNVEALGLIRNMLVDMGMTQIFTAKDGRSALDFLGAFDGEDAIDIVLCDWNMPRMSGLDLLRQIRTCDKDTPFLMITGTADGDSVTKAKSAGVTGYIKKPFSTQELNKKLRIISRIVAHRRGAGNQLA